MRLKIMFKIILVLVFVKSAYSAVPTMEGLFRNGVNPDIVQDLAVLVVKQVNNKLEDGQVVKPENEETVINEQFYKILYNNSAQGPQDIILAAYSNANLEDDNLISVKIYKNEKDMIANTGLFQKKITVAILNMFALNSSVSISNVLKEIDEEFMTNKEMVNKDKKELLEKYKRFLLAKKEYDQKMKDLKKNGANVEEMEKLSMPMSPLNPENVDEKNELNQIMANSLYVPNKMIKLVKDGSEFFWVLQTQKISARFKNDSHLLKILKINNELGETIILPHEYATYQGEYLLPKKIEIRSREIESILEVQNYYLLNSKNKNFSDRIEEYKKILEKEKSSRIKPTIQEDMSLKQYFL